MRSSRRRALAALSLACGAAAAAAAAPTFSSFSASTASGSSQIAAAPDWTAPTAGASAIGKGSGASGRIRPGGGYYVYANVTDSGNPASGVASVRADVSAISAGQSAVTLTAGSYNAGTQSFNYRSAQLAADASVTGGSKAYTLALADSAGNARSESGFSVTVDATPPRPVDVQSENRGATAGKMEAGDTLTFAFSEPVEPGSILPGWSGASTAVQVSVTNNRTGHDDDILQVLDPSGDALPLTSTDDRTGLDLGNRNFVLENTAFSGSTMVMSGATVTVTLGSPSAATATNVRSGELEWTPSALATDLAGNAISPLTPVTEGGPSDVDF